MRAAPIVILALFLVSPADAADKSKAKKHARAGAKLFKAKQYDRALVQFEQAYDAFAVPALRYNIGQCHMLLGRHQDAIEQFEQFLSEDPDTKYRKDVEALIEESRLEIKKAEPEETETPPVTAAPPPPPTAKATPPPPALVEPPVASARTEAPVHETWWFWTIIGGAVVAGGATAAYFGTRTETTTVLPMGDLGVLDRR